MSIKQPDPLGTYRPPIGVLYDFVANAIRLVESGANNQIIGAGIRAMIERRKELKSSDWWSRDP